VYIDNQQDGDINAAKLSPAGDHISQWAKKKKARKWAREGQTGAARREKAAK